jgi:hypothetical protein
VQREIDGSLTEAQKDQEDGAAQGTHQDDCCGYRPGHTRRSKSLGPGETPKAGGELCARCRTLASPAGVGAEREKLENERRQELANRISEYKATMVIMKRRGARRDRPKKAPKFRAGEPEPKAGRSRRYRFSPRIHWFRLSGSILRRQHHPRLEDRLGIPILNLAKAGDEVGTCSASRSVKLLTGQLRNGCPAGGPWDVLLFSGGGNDIVDNPMALWTRLGSGPTSGRSYPSDALRGLHWR